MNLKKILMQLGNSLVIKHGWEPNSNFHELSTKPIVAFTEFVNKNPEVQHELRELGVQWPMKSGDIPLS